MPSLLALLLPARCPVCGAPGGAPCRRCWAQLRPATPASAASAASAPPPGVDACWSLLRYDGAGRELVARLKYRNARSVVAWLAEGMAALVAASVAAGEPVDVVTWAPTSGVRRRQRGFDQAEVLARAVARRLGRPCRRLLVRLPGAPQTGRSGGERRRLGAVFRVAPPAAGLAGVRVLVVDDVLTSGATLSAAASALKGAGAAKVAAVTAGRTPLKVRDRSADP